MLATLLGRVWPRSLFMVKLMRRTLPKGEFMDTTDNFVNAKETLRALIAPWKAKEKGID